LEAENIYDNGENEMNEYPTETRNAFLAGAMDKHAYSKAMHHHHSLLFDYAKLLRGTQVARIIVTEGQVVVVTRDEVKFICDPNDRYIPPLQLLNFGSYEAHEQEILLRLVQPGMNIFDIGANVGWYSLLIAKKAHGCNVYAFEPLPATFGSLKANVDANGYRNIRVFNFGISDKDQQIEFYYSPEISGAASGANILGWDTVTKIDCRVRPLDDVWEELGVRVDFIKCDVEGAELFAFRGGMKCIASDHPIILSEMLRKWSAKFGYHPNEIISLLEGFGYSCYAIAGSRLMHLARMDERTESTNFVFLHSKNHSDLITQLAKENVLQP
jgi:FkbM family methyltransferase